MLAAPTTTRERILVEASRLFAERGYDGTSTRQIADAVGIRQPSLFHHFPSKQAIMESLLELTYAAPAETAERLADEPGPAADRLGAYLRWDVAYTLALPYDLSAAVAGDVLEQPAFARFRRDRDRLHAARRRIIEQGIAAGEFVPIDGAYAQQLVAAVALQTIRLRLGGPDEAAAFVLRGLGHRPAGGEVDAGGGERHPGPGEERHRLAEHDPRDRRGARRDEEDERRGPHRP
jgi:AcrR family transcriptional regulator